MATLMVFFASVSFCYSDSLTSYVDENGKKVWTNSGQVNLERAEKLQEQEIQDPPVVASEVTQCFEKAYGHPDNGGFGLHLGGAKDLCKGTINANGVIQCFAIAYGHPNNGGFGLHLGGAIDLCKGTINENEVIQCFAKAYGHPNNGGLGLNLGSAIELCSQAIE
jgi:hypothetical protein